ncbi:MAG: ATP-binding cassette domain-containing protein [bacterium]|nr:ATP-binding cassette domain-containing protein [bacterium]
MKDQIIIKGARVHNLKDVNLTLPKNKLIVFTGLSGSGKSSLAFDTIFAEGQRRYIESLSPYARQFLGQMEKPDVDEITGLSPAIAIDQKAHSRNPRSTVATLTEIYDYLRILYARIGKPYCPTCGRLIKKMSPEEMVDSIQAESSKLQAKSCTILAPVVRGRKGEYFQLIQDLFRDGFSEARIDGVLTSLHDKVDLKRYGMHTIEVVIDKVMISDKTRLFEAVETALHKGDGLLTVAFHVIPEKSGIQGKKMDPRVKPEDDKLDNELMLSAHWTCPHDNFAFPEIEPRLFSFNSPYGACEACHGIGHDFFDPNLLCNVCNGSRLKPEVLAIKIHGHSIDEVVSFTIDKSYEFFGELEDHLSASENHIAKNVLKEIVARLEFMLEVGLDYLTLKRESGTLSGGESQRIRLASQIGSKLSGTLYVLDEPTIGLHERDNERLIKILKELRDLGNTLIVVEHDERVIKESDFLTDIGPGPGRHGGEIVASGETRELLKKHPVIAIRQPAEKQSIPSVIPAKAGIQKKKMDSRVEPENDNHQESLTLKYLRGEEEIEVPATRRSKDKGELRIIGATANNIKNLNVDIPLGKLVVVTGVSGSGKSTLLEDIVYKNIQKRLGGFQMLENVAKINGIEYIRHIIEIDQSPIGKTPRSNPATYTGVFGPIRDLFSMLPEAQERAYGPGRFSFNVPGGRCEACEGAGAKVIEMHFLPDVLVKCDVCHGKRFNRETLEVKYKGKSIADVLDMTVEEAYELFSEIYHIADKLKVMKEVGLDYIKLGQSATTLSGGEAQRIKLSKELARPMARNDVFILDEPTTGLHYHDVKMLLHVLERLVDKGNTVILIEHNMHVIKTADYIIDMGPEGGNAGGKVIATGTPEEVAKAKGSYTGRYLKEYLSK